MKNLLFSLAVLYVMLAGLNHFVDGKLFAAIQSSLIAL